MKKNYILQLLIAAIIIVFAVLPSFALSDVDENSGNQDDSIDTLSEYRITEYTLYSGEELPLYIDSDGLLQGYSLKNPGNLTDAYLIGDYGFMCGSDFINRNRKIVRFEPEDYVPEQYQAKKVNGQEYGCLSDMFCRYIIKGEDELDIGIDFDDLEDLGGYRIQQISRFLGRFYRQEEIQKYINNLKVYLDPPDEILSDTEVILACWNDLANQASSIDLATVTPEQILSLRKSLSSYTYIDEDDRNYNSEYAIAYWNIYDYEISHEYDVRKQLSKLKAASSITCKKNKKNQYTLRWKKASKDDRCSIYYSYKKNGTYKKLASTSKQSYKFKCSKKKIYIKIKSEADVELLCDVYVSGKARYSKVKAFKLG